MLMLPLLIAARLMSPAQDAGLQMTTYQMVLLRKTAVPESALPNMAAAQQEHLDRLAALNRQRVNRIYGPMTDGGDLVGIAVLAVATADEARAAFAQDPFVKAGVLRVDVRPWFGPQEWFHAPASYDVHNPDTLEPLIFGFLVDGPTRTHDEATAAEIQKGHLAYMASLADQGTLVMAGPFMDGNSPRGIVVYRVKTIDEAKTLAAGDPAVKAGRLMLEAHPWMTLRGILK